MSTEVKSQEKNERRGCKRALCCLGIGASVLLVGVVCLDMWLDHMIVAREVISRVVSRTYDAEAWILTSDAGATTSTCYTVYVRQHGVLKPTTEVLRMDDVEQPEKLRINWNDEGLVITMPPEYQLFAKKDSVRLGWRDVPVTFVYTGDSTGIRREIPDADRSRGR